MPRYSINMSDEDRDLVKAIADAEDRTMASMLRYIFHTGLHVCKSTSKQRQNDVKTASIQRQNDVKTTSKQQCPTPARAPASSTSEKKEEKKKNKKGDARLAPLDVAGRILDHLNQKAGTGFRASGAATRKLIATRLAEGWSEADFLLVIDKKCREWLTTDMDRYLQPSTLFGTKFEQYHGQKDVGPKRPLATTEGEKRAQRFEERREADYTRGDVIVAEDEDLPDDIPF